MGRKPDETEQLASAVDELRELIQRAEGLMLREPGVAKGRTATLDIPLNALQQFYEQRRIRNAVFADHVDLFGEPAWDILLDVAIMEQRNKPHLVTAACIGSGAPATTALRYIKVMEERGLLESEDDTFDKRKRYLRVTRKGWGLLKRFLENSADRHTSLSRL